LGGVIQKIVCEEFFENIKVSLALDLFGISETSATLAASSFEFVLMNLNLLTVC
jgi:hypothetical protein